MFDWVIGPLNGLFGFATQAAGAVAGWAWDKVTTGVYTWLANGLALLIEWVWSVLDTASTPRVTAGWFANDLAVRLGLLGLAVTVAMMLASAIQAALAGRPEQIGDAVKHAVWAIVASAFTVTALDVSLGVVDEAARVVWASGRADLVTMLERVVTVATTTGPLTSTFVGPLCLLVGFVGMIGLVVSLLMRSALIYLVAALAPLVWSANVLPLFRGSARKLVHLAVALVAAKLAIVVSLVVAVKLISHPAAGDVSGVVNDGAAAVGTLLAGFVCFVIAAVSPLVLYKLMPVVEGAAVGAGIAGGVVPLGDLGSPTALMVKSFGATAAGSAATRPVAANPTPGSGGAAGGPGPRGGIAGLTGVAPPTTSSGIGREPPGGSGTGVGAPSTGATGGPTRERGALPVRPGARAAPATGPEVGGGSDDG